MGLKDEFRNSGNKEVKMEKRGWCGPCHNRCGLLIKTERDRAIAVRGDDNHPISRGFICEKGRLILDHLYHKDRLNYPLKRAGAKGENRWKKISWDEALDEIADRLNAIKEKYGAEAVAFAHGTYRTYGWAVKRFFNLFGSPNIMGAVSICRCPSWAVEWATLGYASFSDIRNSSLIVLWGSHLRSSYPDMWADIVKLKKSGVKLIVVDPMRREEADLADIWIPLRPGTDLMLMLSWIKLIIEEELYDKEFVGKWCYGFERLVELIKSHSYEEAERITGAPKELVISAARLYATTKPASFPWGLGMDKQGVNAQQVQRARLILHALTGNIDVKGGELVGRNGLNVITDYEMELNHMLPESQQEKQLGSDFYKLMAYPGWKIIKETCERFPKDYTLPPVAEEKACAHARVVFEAMLTGKPYPVKALFCQGSNPLITLPNPKRNYEAILNAELVVVMDYYMTPTAMLADFVLPAASTLERADIQDMHSYANFIIGNPKAIDPLYERKEDYFLWKELGKRLGQKEYWPWEEVEEVFDYRLSPLGIRFSELCDMYLYTPGETYKKYEKYGFATLSGKVELYSNLFERLGLDPLPLYKEPPESPFSQPELFKEYPLILMTGNRFLPMYHSELRQIEKARKKRPYPYAELNPETAKRFGVQDGDWILVENQHGAARFVARLNERMGEDMIHLEHGWWFPEKEGKIPSLFGAFESNCNMLCPDDDRYVSREIGSWPHTALLCRIRKEGK